MPSLKRPLTIVVAGAVLMWLLTRKGLALQLYLAVFALWLVTTTGASERDGQQNRRKQSR